MPTYVYQCPACQSRRDVIHPMDECSGPHRPETILATSCYGQEAMPHDGTPMVRVFAGAAAIGTGLTGAGIARRKQQVRQRSNDHFKKEIRERKETIMKDPLRQV